MKSVLHYEEPSVTEFDLQLSKNIVRYQTSLVCLRREKKVMES